MKQKISGAARRKALLFLKKKKQKDFYCSAGSTIEAMAGIFPPAPG